MVTAFGSTARWGKWNGSYDHCPSRIVKKPKRAEEQLGERIEQLKRSIRSSRESIAESEKELGRLATELAKLAASAKELEEADYIAKRLARRAK